MDDDPITDETAAGEPADGAGTSGTWPIADPDARLIDEVWGPDGGVGRDPAAALVERLTRYRIGPAIHVGEELGGFLSIGASSRPGDDEVDEFGLGTDRELPSVPSVVPLRARRRASVGARAVVATAASVAVVTALGATQSLPAAAQSLFSRAADVVGIGIEGEHRGTAPGHGATPPGQSKKPGDE